MKLIKNLFSPKYKARTISYLLVIVAYIVLTIFQASGSMTNMFKNLLVPTCCYVVAAISLNLVVGFSGELSLGHAGFMCVGAFSAICVSGYLATTVESAIVRLAISIVVGAILAAIFGFLISIPVLKLSGDYLAIVTLAFCQIIKSIVQNVYIGFDSRGFQFSFVNNDLDLEKGGKILIKGAMGATGVERIATFEAGIILIIVTLIVVYHIINSNNGRKIMAARDNRIAAQSVGIDVTYVKTLAFTVSAALAGAAGALYGLNYSTLMASKFDFNLSILVLLYIVLGGLGKINGTIVATCILFILPEMLRGLADYRMIIYAVILIVMMLATNNETLHNYLNLFTNKFTSLFKKGDK